MYSLKEYYAENMEDRTSSADNVDHEKTVATNDLLNQLYEIQYQIEALENEVSTDVQTQLHAVKEQLSKIVDNKTSQKTSKVLYLLKITKS